MEYIKQYQNLISFLLGVVCIVGISFIYNPFATENQWYHVSEKDEVHVHADFLMYILDERIDLTADKYQSSIDNILLEDFHLHDNNDEVLHRHAEGLTLVAFLQSVGFTLTNDCVTNDLGEQYCTDETNTLTLFINGQAYADVNAYIPQEEDQILVYYGDVESPALQQYLKEISTDSCIYSGTCPEKGTPPPESCGLTCEI